MGQRLVVEFKEKDDVVAAGYYHWDAYTMPAMITLDKIIHSLNDEYQMKEAKALETNNVVAQAATAMTNNGAFIEESELPYVEDKALAEYLGTLNTLGNRNDGIVSVTHEDIAESIRWSEGFIGVDIPNREFVFGVYCSLTPEEYNDIYVTDDEYTELPFEECNVYTCPIEMDDRVGFDAINEFYDMIDTITSFPSHTVDENGDEKKNIIMYKGDIFEPIY